MLESGAVHVSVPPPPPLSLCQNLSSIVLVFFNLYTIFHAKFVDMFMINTIFHETWLCTNVTRGTDTNRHGHTLYFPEQPPTFLNSIALAAMCDSFCLNYTTLCPPKLHNHYQIVNSPHTNHCMHELLKLHFCMSKSTEWVTSRCTPMQMKTKCLGVLVLRVFHGSYLFQGSQLNCDYGCHKQIPPLTNGWCVQIHLNEMFNSVGFGQWYGDSSPTLYFTYTVYRLVMGHVNNVISKAAITDFRLQQFTI